MIGKLHSHWRFKKPARFHYTESHDETDPKVAAEAAAEAAVAELLRVNEPAAATLRGRPLGAKNKQKKRTREQAFEDSTQRDPSGFKYVQQEQQQRQEQREFITVSEVEKQVEDYLLDEFFDIGRRSGGLGSSGTTRTSTPRGVGTPRRGNTLREAVH